MEKKAVYFMPGMAANEKIFINIKLDNSEYEPHYLHWIIPEKNESIENYCKRLSTQIDQPNPILIGVSFGGVIVQELSRILKVQKVILISSIKSDKEMPKRLLFFKQTKAYKMLATELINSMDKLVSFVFGVSAGKKLELMDTFLNVREPEYLQWAITTILNWSPKETVPNLVHIHGDKDEVFPIKHISDCHVVPNGDHAMILTKYRWLNEHLPKLIKE